MALTLLEVGILLFVAVVSTIVSFIAILRWLVPFMIRQVIGEELETGVLRADKVEAKVVHATQKVMVGEEETSTAEP